MKTYRLLLLLALLAVSGCAKQGLPTGGPKDTTPPKVLSTKPENGSLNFAGKEFFIGFDEYVTVKDADNNILVSPPMQHKPDYTPKGHGLLVRLKDTLQPNTTYLFQFKGAIVDFNEGNPLNSYEYVFSTGDVIDSMTIRGKVTDALLNKPREEVVSIFAYSLDSTAWDDSTAAKVQPTYVTRCDKEGNFAFNHIRSGQYKLIALEDGDKDLRYGANEAIGWLDTLVTAVHMPAPIAHDSASRDSATADSTLHPIGNKADTASQADTSHHHVIATPSLPSHHLLISSQEQQVQRLIKSEFLSRGRIQLIAQMPMTAPQVHRMADTAHLAPIDSLLVYAGTKGDTLNIWTLDPKCDSTVLLVTDATGLQDTLKLKYREKKKPKVGGASSNTPAPPKPVVKSLVSQTANYFDTLWLAFENPIAVSDTSRFFEASCTNLTDSIDHRCDIRWNPRQVGLSAYILSPNQPGKKYQYLILPGTFTDIYGRANDSLTFTTEFTKPENYGLLRVSLQHEDSTAAIVCQLLDEKDQVLRELPFAPTLTFANLKAGKYRLRAFVDLNGDSKWTPGDYWQHRQPEPVFHFSKSLDVRENWEMEEKWEF